MSTAMNYNNVSVSKKMVNVWLWMLEESEDEKLEEQAQRLLLTLFPSINEARDFSQGA
jgi:hypothetical protein